MNLHVQTRLTRCALDFDRAREGRALALVVQGGSVPVVLMWQEQACALLETPPLPFRRRVL